MVDCFRLSDIAGRSLSLEEVHATTFYEIFFFTEGSGAVLLEGNRIQFKAPAVLLLPPARPRRWLLKTPPDCMMAIFEGAFLESFLKDQLFLDRLYYYSNVNCPPLLPLEQGDMGQFLQLLYCIKNEISDLQVDGQQLLRAYLYQLLILLNRNYAAYYHLKGNLYRNADILKFKSLLKQHIHEKQSVKEYAELLKISRNRLSQLCHEAFGKHATEIIRNELLQACKNELLTSDKTIAEIGYQYNFSAPSNFVRFFKSMTNSSPAAYREQYAN